MISKCSRSFRVHFVLGCAITVVSISSVAKANSFLDDSYVSASPGQNSTSWINANPFKPLHSNTAGGEFRWADTAHNACFLTGVGGDFNGAGERAYVYEDRGSWAFGVSSGSGQGTFAMASCVTIPDASYQWPAPTSPGVTWYQGYYPTAILTPAPKAGYNWTCFLTQVRGNFQGGGERVEVYKSGSQWVIGGSSAQRDVMGEARCVQTRNQSSRFSVVQGGTNFIQMQYAGGTNYGQYLNDYRNMYPNNLNSCFLQKIAGKFEGAGEQVRVITDGQSRTVGWSNYWWLELYSQQRDVAGAAQCVW